MAGKPKTTIPADLEKPKSQRALVRDLERQRRLILTGQGLVREAKLEADAAFETALAEAKALFEFATDKATAQHWLEVDGQDRRMAELEASLAVCDAGIAAVKPALKVVDTSNVTTLARAAS